MQLLYDNVSEVWWVGLKKPEVHIWQHEAEVSHVVITAE